MKTKSGAPGATYTPVFTTNGSPSYSPAVHTVVGTYNLSQGQTVSQTISLAEPPCSATRRTPAPAPTSTARRARRPSP